MSTHSLSNPFPDSIRTVGVFSPAGVAEGPRLERGLARLREWGITIVAEEAPSPDRFFAGTDPQRAEALNALLRNPHVDALMATRGGYGCARLLERIDWGLLLRRNLPLIGYSDITAIHAMAFRRLCRNNIAGPMAASTLGREAPPDGSLNRLSTALRSFARVLRGDSFRLHETALSTLRGGCAVGPVLPANLSVLTSLVGTGFMPDLSGVILVIEDVNEAAYRVDRFLNQLDQAGCLSALAGLVFGQFTDCEDSEWLPHVFADFAARVDGPVAEGLPFGHDFPSISVPVGRDVRLETEGAHAWLDLL